MTEAEATIAADPTQKSATEAAAETASAFWQSLPAMPPIPTEVPEWLIVMLIWVLKFLAPLLALYLLFQAGKVVYSFAMTQWVEGKPNEWVVIMRNGEALRKGIGLSTFKNPFD